MINTYIFFFSIFIFEAIIFLQYCSSIFITKCSVLKRCLFIVPVYIAIFAIFKFGHPMINFFFLCLGNFIFLYFLYNTTWYIAAFHSVIDIIIMSLWESAIILIIPYPYSYSFDSLAKAFHIWMIPAILSKFLYALTMLILEIIIKRYSQQNIAAKPPLILLIPPIASMYLICCYVRFAGEAQLSPGLSKMLIIATVLLLLLNISVVITYNYIVKRSNEYASLQLLLQREQDISEYYKTLITETENRNRFIHDIKKHLQSIAILNQNRESEKIDSYINTLINSSELQTSVRLCNHELLNAIFCRYLMKCRKDNIDFRADIRKDSCIFLSETDMTSLFCNLLDNALEAARYIPDSFIELAIHQQPQTAFTIITLVNSCRNNPFSGTGKRLITTKENKTLHGHGLKIIERIVNRYRGNMDYYYSEECHEFHMIIAMKDPRM